LGSLEILHELRFDNAYKSYQDSALAGDALTVESGLYRLPHYYMAAYGQSSATRQPYVALVQLGANAHYLSGLVDFAKASSGNNTGTVLLWEADKPAHTKLVSAAVLRVTGNLDHVQVGPCVRASDGSGSDAAGKKCYAVELHYNAGTTAWDAKIFRYSDYNEIETGDPFGDGATGSKTLIGTVASVASKFPGAAGTDPTKYLDLLIGLKATGAVGAAVTISVYVAAIAKNFTGGPTVYSSVVGVPKTLTPTGSVVDSAASGTRLDGADNVGVGLKWRYRAAALTAPNFNRVVRDEVLFCDSAGTSPATPTLVDATYSTDCTEVVLTTSAFSDTDGTDTHAKTRVLLYEAPANAFAAWFPTRDTGFQTDLTSIALSDLAPGKAYSVRVQYLDSDGDVSPLSGFYPLTPTKAQLSAIGLVGLTHFYDSSAHFGSHPNAAFDAAGEDQGGLEEVFQLRHDGEAATGYGPTLTRRTDLSVAWTRYYRHWAFRKQTAVTGASSPVYPTVLASEFFVYWAHNSGVFLGTRCTYTDTDGFFVTKYDGDLIGSPGNWVYTVVRRTLQAGKVYTSNTTTDWDNTVVFNGLVAKTAIGIHGERIIFSSYDSGAGKALALYVNGILAGSYTGVLAEQGYGDAGHEYSAVLVEKNNSGVAFIQQYGQSLLGSGYLPALPITVDPMARDTGGKMHHPGPFMDPFDSGTDVGGVENCWRMKGGFFSFRTGAAIGSVNGIGMLVHRDPFLATYDYLVRADFYNCSGPIARFTDKNNFIVLYTTSVTGTGLGAGGSDASRGLQVVVVEGGAIVSVFGVTVNDYVEGSQLGLQVVNEPGTPGRIKIRAFYDSTALAMTYVSGSGSASGGLMTVDLSSNSVLLGGRFGVYRSPTGVLGGYNDPAVPSDNTVAVCGSIECVEGLGSEPPAAPTLTGTSGDATVKVSIVVASSAFSDADIGATHAASQWQVRDDVTLATVYDSGEIVWALTSHIVAPDGGNWNPNPGDTPGLNPSSNYSARVRHRDETGLWSPWSGWTAFVTSAPAPAETLAGELPFFPDDPLPSQDFSDDVAFNTLVSTTETGREQRIAKWTAPRRTFKLSYGPVTPEQIDVIWDFFQTVRGRTGVFYFRHPTRGTVHVCRFAEDNMTRQTIEYAIEQVGLALIEVVV
jgi:hypothetical protein